MFMIAIRRANSAIVFFSYIWFFFFLLKGIPHLISMHDVSKEKLHIHVKKREKSERVGQDVCSSRLTHMVTITQVTGIRRQIPLHMVSQ